MPVFTKLFSSKPFQYIIGMGGRARTFGRRMGSLERGMVLGGAAGTAYGLGTRNSKGRRGGIMRGLGYGLTGAGIGLASMADYKGIRLGPVAKGYGAKAARWGSGMASKIASRL